jgi:hypothetical protein
MRTAAADEYWICPGDAQPADAHLLADVHCVDTGIVKWLASRRRRWKLAQVGHLIEREPGRETRTL